MSTDTAFALGALALAGRAGPVRTYLLTFALVDDVAGIAIIALAYSGAIDLAALGVGVAILGAVIVVRQQGVRNGAAYLLLGVAAWIAFFQSGVDPVVVGLVMGLFAVAYPVARSDLERAYESFRLFREQPVPELAREARERVRTAISPNDRLQQLFHPWTSYLIVPLFALANAGITVSGSFLAHAFASRSRSGSCSATWWASRSAPSARPGFWPGSAAAGSAHRSAGPRSPALGLRGHRLQRRPADRPACHPGSQLAEAKLAHHVPPGSRRRDRDGDPLRDSRTTAARAARHRRTSSQAGPVAPGRDRLADQPPGPLWARFVPSAAAGPGSCRS